MLHDEVIDLLRRLDATDASTACDALPPLLREGERCIRRVSEPVLRDALLARIMRRVDQFEVAAYRNAHDWAGALGHENAANVLHAVLICEQAAERRLSVISGTLLQQSQHAAP